MVFFLLCQYPRHVQSNNKKKSIIIVNWFLFIQEVCTCSSLSTIEFGHSDGISIVFTYIWCIGYRYELWNNSNERKKYWMWIICIRLDVCLHSNKKKGADQPDWIDIHSIIPEKCFVAANNNFVVSLYRRQKINLSFPKCSVCVHVEWVWCESQQKDYIKYFELIHCFYLAMWFVKWFCSVPFYSFDIFFRICKWRICKTENICHGTHRETKRNKFMAIFHQSLFFYRRRRLPLTCIIFFLWPSTSPVLILPNEALDWKFVTRWCITFAYHQPHLPVMHSFFFFQSFSFRFLATIFF